MRFEPFDPAGDPAEVPAPEPARGRVAPPSRAPEPPRTGPRPAPIELKIPLPVYSALPDDDQIERDYTTNLPAPRRRRNIWRWIVRGMAGFVVLFVLAVAWLAVTAPLSRSLKPPAPPSITLLSAEGTPIARRGAVIGRPVDATKLPPHVADAFLAIEDRRFRSHWGVDPRGIARAMVRNVFAGGVRQGGSTITQQLAKNAFLDADRTAARKLQEVLIAFWLEAWLTKDEILSRYLSNVYFGDNVYGLDAAAHHYFSIAPEDLSIGQAAMLAGLVKAPSRLAPTGNLKGARDRQKLVVAAMVETGMIDRAEAERVRPARLKVRRSKELPNGTYFADWVLPAARDRAGEIAEEQRVTTTLETRLQKAAERAVAGAGLKKSQIAIVAMRPDGRVVAMVGGKNYRESPFNRATQARRQPGSTFKLFVYLAAIRAGMTPDSLIDDSPVTIGDWKPENSDGRYLGLIPLEEAFARSSNVAAARLTQRVGVREVTRAARDLGISTPIGNDASIALGTSTVSLLELTAAYAAIAAGEAPVRPRGLEEGERSTWLGSNGPHPLDERELGAMRELLAGAVDHGTAHRAGLSVETFGKTGTTQDNRDALFIGYAEGIVAGVWMGNDDNTPNPGLAGGGLPARVWRDFMTRAVNAAPAVREPVVPASDEDMDEPTNFEGVDGEQPPFAIEGEIGGVGLNLRVGPNGEIDVGEPEDRRDERQPRDRDRRSDPDRDRLRLPEYEE